MDQGHPEFKTIRIADLLRECGVAPTDPMQDIREGHRYILFLNPEQVGTAAAKKLSEALTAKGYDILVLLLPPGSARLCDVSETGEVEHFAYFNSNLLCSECGWAMSSASNFTVRPFDYIVYCGNSSCSKKDIRFRVRASQGTKLERITDETRGSGGGSPQARPSEPDALP